MVEIEIAFSCGCGAPVSSQMAAEVHARQRGHVLSARMGTAGFLAAGPRGRRRIGRARRGAARVTEGNGDGQRPDAVDG